MTQETPETRLALLEDAFRRVSGTLTSIETILTNISQQLADKAVDSARVRSEVFGRLGHIETEQHEQNIRLGGLDEKITGITEKLDQHILLDSWTRRGLVAVIGGGIWFLVWAWDHITVAVK